MHNKKKRVSGLLAALCLASLAGCSVPEPRQSSSGHIGSESLAPQAPKAAIPAPVERTPYLPPPTRAAPVETYTVVVNEVPAKELLFALARDAELNVDISPEIEGNVTLNAINQTLTQILDRVSRQVDMRYETKQNTLVVSPDTPFFKVYKIDYVNLSREATSSASVNTQVFDSSIGEGGGGSGGGSNSTTDIESASTNRFWENLAENIRSLVASDSTDAAVASSVLPQPESGTLLVRATARQHEKIGEYVDLVMVSVRRQVLIEATIVEVRLDDTFSAGIDWQLVTRNLVLEQNIISDGATAPNFSFNRALTEGFVATNPFFVALGRTGDFQGAIRALSEFGDTRVLSSPKIMALNNQPAVLKVTRNEVFFDIEADTVTNDNQTVTTVDTTARTVPTGLIMSMIPQVSANGTVTLHVRPTISSIAAEVADPNPLIEFGNSVVPEIQTREIESVLKLNSGQAAILGGLMQDSVAKGENGLPVISEIPVAGNLFKSVNNVYVKSELVIFVRPTVIKSPSLEADLAGFQQYLPDNQYGAKPLPSLTLPEGLTK